jgi:two-component system, cell cycle response regulator DivK
MRSLAEIGGIPIAMTKILLVEDHPELRHLLQGRIEGMGFTTIIAKNGKEGVDTAVAEKPDLILMNSMMPEMDGWEATRILRSNPQTKDIPILAATAMFRPADLRAWLDVGCNDYILKPFTLDELSRKIRALIS